MWKLRFLAFMALALGSLSLVNCSGCQSRPFVKITYDQIGACATGGFFPAGNNSAYVFMRLESIDNSATGQDFEFYAGRLTINTDDPFPHPEGYLTEELCKAYQLPYARKATIAKGTSQNIGAYVVFRVITDDVDGPKEANSINYLLTYGTLPSEPGVLLVKQNPTRVSWPYTPSCGQVQFVR